MFLPGLTAALAVALLASGGAPTPAPRPGEAPRAQVRFAAQLTRADSGQGSGNGPNTLSAPQVIGTPVLTTLDGGTASVSLTGGDVSYAISLSPTVEASGTVAVLWNLQLSGRNLPGASSANQNGATRVNTGRQEPVAEVSLRDPKTGRQSAFRLQVTTTVTKP